MRSGTRNPTAPAQPTTPAVNLKLALMAAIDEGIGQRYNTLQEAARVANVGRELLSRVRRGDHRRCSIVSLLRIADQLRIHIRIQIELVSTPKRCGNHCHKIGELGTKDSPNDFDIN